MYKCVEIGELYASISLISKRHGVYYNKVKRAISAGNLLFGYTYIEVKCENECSCKKVSVYGDKD